MAAEMSEAERDARGTLTDEEYAQLQAGTERMNNAPKLTEFERELAREFSPGAGVQDDRVTAVDTVEQMRDMMPVTREKIKSDYGGAEGKQASGIRGPQGLYWSDPSRDNDAAHVVGGNGLERAIDIGNYNNFGGLKRPLWRRWTGSENGWVHATTEEGEAAYSDRRAWRTIRGAVGGVPVSESNRSIGNATPLGGAPARTETTDERLARLKRELAAEEAGGAGEPPKEGELSTEDKQAEQISLNAFMDGRRIVGKDRRARFTEDIGKIKTKADADAIRAALGVFPERKPRTPPAAQPATPPVEPPVVPPVPPPPATPPPPEPTQPIQQIPPHRPAAPLTKFFRRLFGIYDRDPILEKQLNDPHRSEREKSEIRGREALVLGSLGINADAQDRSLKEQWKNVRDKLHLEGVARTVLISAAVVTVLASVVGTGGLTLGWLGGVVAGKIARNVIEKRQKKDGEAGKMATFKRLAGSSIIGIGAGVAIGLATGSLDWSGIWDRLTGGGVPTGPSDMPDPTSASTGQETAGWSPPAPKGFVPAEFNDLGQVLQLTSGGESVWDGITSGMIEHNLLDHRGQQAFAQAFHKTVDSGFRDLFLSCGGESVGNTPWNKLPAGTVANFEKLFNNPEFVEKFCANIGRNYPSLADKIDASGFTVKQFIRGYAYLHGARIP